MLTGVLLVNLGTPDAPTAKALRRYLAEFLWDIRVTELPRWFWWLVLHGVILRIRPARSARLYEKVWTENGSPLLSISKVQAQALQKSLGEEFKVVLAMRYGNPSIASGLEELRNVERIVVLPLYPQYSGTTTGSSFDAVADVLKTWRRVPDLRFISHYHDDSAYINALIAQIKSYWDQHGVAEKLLFSFHGIPKRFVIAGDPYADQCHKTAKLVASGLEVENWEVVFQSRFGREEWLKPYADHRLIALAKDGIKRVDVVCPGFSADCLETLDEINRENRDIFLKAGGEEFHYIPALNDSDEHIEALVKILK
jgi:ferrochelatase